MILYEDFIIITGFIQVQYSTSQHLNARAYMNTSHKDLPETTA